MTTIAGRFKELISQITAEVAPYPVEEALASRLDARFPSDDSIFQELERLCKSGLNEGWLCTREAGNIKFGRVIKAGPDSNDFSVDVVLMDDIVGPFHVHPRGEIDMIMPIDSDARFDGSPRGWKVYPPHSSHHPTVSGGRALILYLLPGGAIEFKPDRA